MSEGTTASSVAIEILDTVRNIVLAVSPWVPHQKHYGVDGFTAEELTAAIARDVPGARIERVIVERDSVGTTDQAPGHALVQPEVAPEARRRSRRGEGVDQPLPR
jgi:hypothetical protein